MWPMKTNYTHEICSGKDIKICETSIFSLHSSLIDELIDDCEKGHIRTRPVRISGTNYIPPKNKVAINQSLSSVIYDLEKIKNPLEKAINIHCNLARIQPFIDGNKRTARLLESIVLMQNDIIPIFNQI